MSDISQIQSLVGAKADGIWGPKTQAAVAEKLKCSNTVKAIQTAVGAKADGILGPKSYAAILAKLGGTSTSVSSTSGYHLFLDPGHTADYGREHPSQFASGLWESGKASEIAKLLGFNSKTNDSVEHILNVNICNKIKEYAEKAGLKVYMYDNPSLSNNAEITQVYTKVNSIKPKVFVSIHNNAAGSSNWKSLGSKATGTVSLYKSGRNEGKKLASYISDKLITLRKSTGGPHNRAESVTTTNVAVLNNASSVIPSTLVEVGFYDNAEDLYWMATHLNEIGKAVVEGVVKYIS